MVRRADGAPTSLDIVAVRLRVAFGHMDTLGRPLCPDHVSGAGERRPLARRELADPVEHRVDHILARRGETLGVGEERQAAIDASYREILDGFQRDGVNGTRMLNRVYETRSEA